MPPGGLSRQGGARGVVSGLQLERLLWWRMEARLWNMQSQQLGGSEVCHVVVLCDFGWVGQILSLVFVFLTCKMEGLEFVLF